VFEYLAAKRPILAIGGPKGVQQVPVIMLLIFPAFVIVLFIFTVYIKNMDLWHTAVRTLK